jgi:peptidylprolyl isomerase
VASRYPAAAVTHRTLLVFLVAAVLAAAGCGGSSKDESAAKPTATPKATPTPDLSDTSKKPEVTVPDELPPDTLQSKDIVEGKGPKAKKGDKVTVEYVGVAWSTGVEFDTSWGKQPFTFELGKGAVIKGWDEGVPGMRVGGRRELTIPADQAYGAQGSPPSIGPNECLRFVIDLKKIG